MKYLKSYKLFESVDLIPLESTVNDIALELEDSGYEVLVDIIYDEAQNEEAIRIEVSSSCRENLYSKWRQDQENFAKREYEKCKDVLDRIDDFLTSSGLEAISKNNIRKGRSGKFLATTSTTYGQLEHGTLHRCYEPGKDSCNWTYEIVYEPSNVNEGFFGSRKWWFQKGKKDPDRVFNKDLKLDVDDIFYDIEDLGFEVEVKTPDPNKIDDSREKSKDMEDPKWYEKTVTVNVSKIGNESFSFEELIDKVIFMISFLKGKWNLELKMIDGSWNEPAPRDRVKLSPLCSRRSGRRRPYYMNTHYFDKGGLRRDKKASLFRTGLPTYNEESLRRDFMSYFGYFGNSIVELVFTFKID